MLVRLRIQTHTPRSAIAVLISAQIPVLATRTGSTLSAPTYKLVRLTVLILRYPFQRNFSKISCGQPETADHRLRGIEQAMQLRKMGAFLLSVVFISALIGCGASEQPIQQASDQEVAQMKELRTIFDSVKGDYNQLTPDQKKKFLDYTKGNQAQADGVWDHMKNPRGKSSDATRPFSLGAGGKILPPGSDPNAAGANR